MKYLIILYILALQCYAGIQDISSFEADFTQSVTNDKGNVLKYKGHVFAKKPQYALWNYTKPAEKSIYINKRKVTIIEPEIEQAIVKKLDRDFDFFRIIKNAIKLDKERYQAKFENQTYILTMKGAEILSISYKDSLDNVTNILFTNQKQNANIDTKVFQVNIPTDYDIISKFY